VIKPLFRISSPVGEMGSQALESLGSPQPPTARCFEAVSSVQGSMVIRFVSALLAVAMSEAVGQSDSDIRAYAFLLPKQGDTLDKCEDVAAGAVAGPLALLAETTSAASAASRADSVAASNRACRSAITPSTRSVRAWASAMLSFSTRVAASKRVCSSLIVCRACSSAARTYSSSS
jgi:hypothetical protein